MIKRFLFYGIAGLVIEIFWTAIISAMRGDKKLTGNTSLLMIPIYGSVVFFEPLCLLIANMPFILRGAVYTVCIFAAEYFSGYALEGIIGVCPWDYSNCKYNIYGLIRLDYAPCWFAVGMLYEKIFHYAI